MSPEHNVHKQEKLSAEVQATSREAKLKALREGNFEAYSLATPKGSPQVLGKGTFLEVAAAKVGGKGSLSNPLTSIFVQGPNLKTVPPRVVVSRDDPNYEAAKTAGLLVEGVDSASTSAWDFAPMDLEEAFNKEAGVSGGAGGSSGLGGAEGSEVSLPQVLEAVNKVQANLGWLQKCVAKKHDLAVLQQQLLEETDKLVDAKLKPLQEKLDALEAKNSALEAEVQELKRKQAITTSTTTSTNLPPQLDLTTKRAAFLGWPDTVSARSRVQQMEAFLDNSFPEFKPVTYVNQYKGPYNNRKLGTVSFVEFGDKDTAKDFVQAVESSGLQVQAGGKMLVVKKARTQQASSRNWALRKAEELLKAAPGTKELKLKCSRLSLYEEKSSHPRQLVKQSLVLVEDNG